VAMFTSAVSAEQRACLRRRCLATLKMHSPEGFGVIVRYLRTGSSASGEAHLRRLCGHSLIASAAPRGSRHWRCASGSGVTAQWRRLCELERLVGHLVCCPLYKTR
jgi:hypothetical protein